MTTAVGASTGWRGTAAVAFLVALAACGSGEGGSSSSTAAPDPPEPWFEEVAGQLGIGFVHESGAEGDLLFPEIMSGGVALLDADGDDDLDAYFVQGGDPTGRANTPDELWRNDGGVFLKVESGVDEPPGYGMGAAAADVDGDGDTDLYVTRLGRDVLLRNDTIPGGPIRFVDVTSESGIDASGWSSSAGFFDADGDGDLDLFVVRYVAWTLAGDLDCYSSAGVEDYCSPQSYAAPLPDLLYENLGADESARISFRDVSLEAGLRSAFGNGLGLVFLDLDDDLDTDVFVANDQDPDQLWRNRGDGTFVDAASMMGSAVGADGRPRAGMGAVAADLDDDGDDDLLVVNLERQSDSLLRNDGAFFTEVTGRAGLGTVSRRYTRFGVGLVDFDHDGFLDLFVANGRVTLPSGATAGPSGDDPFAEPNLLLAGGPGGRFAPVEPSGGTRPPLVATSRGAAFGDLDGDGGVDVVVVNRDGPAHVLRNRRSPRGHWIRFALENLPGRTAHGAAVSLSWRGRTLTRRVAPTSSYQSSHDPRVHFGLGGPAPTGDVVEATEVRWPDGTRQRLGSLAIDRDHRIRRLSPIVPSAAESENGAG